MGFQRALFAIRMRRWRFGALFLGLALFCYWPALRGAFVWDDQAHVGLRRLRLLRPSALVCVPGGATWVERRSLAAAVHVIRPRCIVRLVGEPWGGDRA